MIVRPMQVHEPVAEILEHRKCGRAAIHELPVRPRCGEDALDQELAVFARLDALLFELRVEGTRFADFEDRLDRAGLGAGPEQGFIRPVAQDELERAHDDRFARARFASDDRVARPKLPGELLDQGEIANAEIGESGGHGDN